MNILDQTILLSMLPISELRGAIPLAVFSGSSFWPILIFVAILANIAVVPFIFYFLDNIHNSFMKINVYRKVFENTANRTRKRIESKIGTKAEFLALYFLVAIPLPMTGAYTGSLAAWLFGLSRKKSLQYIIYGVVTAGIITSLITLFFETYF